MTISLEEIDKIIESWVIPNNITLFKGVLKGNSISRVAWEDNSKFLDFLEIGNKFNSKMLIYYKSIFEIEDEIEMWKIEMIEENKVKKEILNQYNELKKRNGEIEFIALTWIIDNIAYECPIFNDISDIVREFKDRIDELSTASTVGSIRFHRGAVLHTQPKVQPKKMREIAKKLASHSDYHAFRYVSGKQMGLLTEILDKEKDIDELDLLTKQQIVSEANMIFDEKFAAKIELEQKAKVKELKAQGMSKIAIRGKLNLSDRTLNKFWYDE